MKLVIIVLVLMLAGGAQAATIWDVEYFIRGDISQVTKFYDQGAYLFLYSSSQPQNRPVYLLEPGKIYYPDGTSYIGLTWVFIGDYACAPSPYSSCTGIGGAVLPDGFPLIAFPSGYDEAIAVPIFQPDPPPSAAVPEPSTLLLMLSALTVYAVLLGRRALVGEPGRGGGR